MPSKKGTEQALTWLKSKMAEGDTLDAINAEVCYNVIMDLKEKRKVIGALYHQAYTSLRRKEEAVKESEVERLYQAAINTMGKYTRVDIPEEELKEIFGEGDK